MWGQASMGGARWGVGQGRGQSGLQTPEPSLHFVRRPGQGCGWTQRSAMGRPLCCECLCFQGTGGWCDCGSPSWACTQSAKTQPQLDPVSPAITLGRTTRCPYSPVAHRPELPLARPHALGPPFPGESSGPSAGTSRADQRCWGSPVGKGGDRKRDAPDSSQQGGVCRGWSCTRAPRSLAGRSCSQLKLRISSVATER